MEQALGGNRQVLGPVRDLGDDSLWDGRGDHVRKYSIISDIRPLTGADAAAQRDHYFRAAETEVYAPVRIFDDREVQKALVAQPAARGGNLLVIEPPGPLGVPRAAVDVVPGMPNLLAYAELRYRGTEQAREAANLSLPKVMGDAED